jgi:phage-related protein
VVVLILDKARKELYELPKEAQEKFNSLFIGMNNEFRLDLNKFKKLRNFNLYEFRVKHNSNIYRGIGGYSYKIFVLSLIFQKKSQKIPLREIKTALTRYKKYINQKT